MIWHWDVTGADMIFERLKLSLNHWKNYAGKYIKSMKM